MIFTDNQVRRVRTLGLERKTSVREKLGESERAREGKRKSSKLRRARTREPSLTELGRCSAIELCSAAWSAVLDGMNDLDHSD